MATGPRLVNKQFNSPIGLYSQQNIQDTLNKQTKVLNNGAVGIDFNSKPANLANSAVLRMLEEEEQRQRNGQAASTKRIAWPPPAEETDGQEAEHETPAHRQAAPIKLHQSPALSRLIPIEQESAPVSVYTPPQAKVYSPQPKAFSPQPKAYSPQPPLSPQPRTPTQTFPPPIPEYSTFPRKTQSSFASVSPKSFAPVSPQGYESKSPFVGASSVFASVPPPSLAPFSQREYDLLSPQPYHSLSPGGTLASAPLTFSETRDEQPGASALYVAPHQLQFEEPPPTTVTLRPSAPVHQRPAPVVASQPAANSFKGGINMRGDQKWPPQSVKESVAAENEARVSLARGPACRPRKVKKDYTTFFAKNALPNNYPGYKVPPGTQHYDDATGTSQF